jgi:hypothetical protein
VSNTGSVSTLPDVNTDEDYIKVRKKVLCVEINFA